MDESNKVMLSRMFYWLRLGDNQRLDGGYIEIFSKMSGNLLLTTTPSFDTNWLSYNCFFSKIFPFSARKYIQEMISETKYELKYPPSVMV